MEWNKRKIAKTVVGTAAGIGVGAIMTNVIKATNQPSTNIFVRICTLIGAAMLSGLISKHVVNYTEEYVDEIISVGDGAKEVLQEQFTN